MSARSTHGALRVFAQTLAMLFTGCAMSPAAYDALAREVSERNAAREAAALERLRSEGYELIGDVQFIAHLSEPARARCQAWSRTRNEATFAEETARVTVDRAQPNSARLEIDVALTEACFFFDRRTETLRGTGPDGQTHEFSRARSTLIARAPDGSLVYIETKVRIVSDRTVRIEETCNEMPSPGPEPFAQVSPAPVLRAALASSLKTRELEIEREQLDYRCTDIVQ